MQNNNNKPVKGEGDPEQQIYVEEKITSPNGDIKIKKYIKGRFLGKVSLLLNTQGGFAKCYEMTLVEGMVKYAGKLITKSSLTKSRARQKVFNLPYPCDSFSSIVAL
jgi:polo-like kinase 1